jgi:nuclear pore complex protein Nup205
MLDITIDIHSQLQPKNAMYRTAVRGATKTGLPVMGDQTKQTFSQQFIDEALILSDLFDMSEIAAVELLMAGKWCHENH